VPPIGSYRLVEQGSKPHTLTQNDKSPKKRLTVWRYRKSCAEDALRDFCDNTGRLYARNE